MLIAEVAAQVGMTMIETLLISAVGALASCVVYLFFEIRKTSNACEEDRRRLWNYIMRLEGIAKMPRAVEEHTLHEMRPDVPGRPAGPLPA
jgi:hypothetical protein